MPPSEKRNCDNKRPSFKRGALHRADVPTAGIPAIDNAHPATPARHSA
jgi:hypothetical protein